MSSKLILSIATIFTLIGISGCGGDRTVERTEQEIFTEPTTETVEVEVMTEDTFMVERTHEITVDTMRVDGADVPAGATQPGTTRP